MKLESSLQVFEKYSNR